MISNCDFQYTGIMRNAMQSVPIGNGDLGANVWADAEGLSLLLSKTDAWSELHRLLKTGLLKLRLTPNPFHSGTRWRLSYQEGVLYIHAGDAVLTLYADANAPLYVLCYTGSIPRSAELRIVNYRDKPLRIAADDHSNYHMMSSGWTAAGAQAYDCAESADHIFSEDIHSLGQYHHNDTSCYEFTLKHQSLEGFSEKNDPFLNRTFGFLAFSDQLKRQGDSLTAEGLTGFSVSIISHTGIYENAADWVKECRELARTSKTDLAAHKAYWREVWNRSWIEIEGDEEARRLTEAYLAQRYMNLCAGRGKYPIKFNGSIFTCQPSPHVTERENYDYRLWGGPYWFQNTRLIYWSMLYSGDYDLMGPFFRLYLDALPLAKYRTKVHFGHDGACYPETMSLFGSYTNQDYGSDREGRLPGYIPNPYIRYYFVGALELCRMMLEYAAHTEDKSFLREEFFPFAEEILLFFRRHFDVKNGELFIHPTASLETWHECANDTPTIVGLSSVTEGILRYRDLPEGLENLCRELRILLPDIPIAEKHGKPVVAPFHTNIAKERANVENPELYAVFPFDRYRIGRENLSLARNTYLLRDIKESGGWQQHGIQAARLGLSAEAEKEVVSNSGSTNPNCIFPAFWGPNYDWLPDQDNGANLMIALCNMLVQADGDAIRLLPAWQRKWNVRFRLPVGGGNFVEAEFAGEKLISYKLDSPTKQRVLLDEKRV